MTRKSFIAQVQDIIEEVIMSAQSVGDDLWGDTDPKEAARDIADLEPSFAWTDEAKPT